MGLLDQVLGQVLGHMGGSGQPGGTRTGPGGFGNQGGFGGGGLGGGGLGGGGLGGGLGGILSGKGGPVALAILALLASKHLKSGAGGYGSVLRDMFGGQQRDNGLSTGSLPGGGGMLGDNEASRSGGSGGFMDEIGGMLGGSRGSSQGAGGLGGMLGGGMLAGGLGSLLERFTQSGQGDVMQSWIGHGPNQAVSPDELDRSLGAGTVDELSRETGMDRDELLSQLSQTLPQVVDKLTPDGRLPTDEEHSQWV